MHRPITRTALMYNVRSQHGISETLDEIAHSGYDEVALYAMQDDQDEAFLPKGAEGGYILEELEPICHQAVRHGLAVLLFTQYMKRNSNYLLGKPEQTMHLLKIPSCVSGGVTSLETGEQEAGSAHEEFVDWEGRGCIFHPEFKARYARFLTRIARLPGVGMIMANDEARLGASGWAIGCYCEECLRAYREAFDQEMPTSFDWDDPSWRRFIRWRFDRWNSLNAELRDVVRQANPDVVVGYQCTPLADGWRSPAWVSGVDLAGMAEGLDDISLNIYHAITGLMDVPEQFHPPAVSLGEVGRLSVAATRGKSATLMVQGFNPPLYPSQTLERDGWWMGVIPHAVGVNRTFPFAYDTHKANPSIETFQASFALDRELEVHVPMSYVAVVHSTASESYCDALPDSGPQSYHERWLYAASEPLRHCGVPYAYLMDKHLTAEALKAYKAVVLPQVSAVDDEGLAALEDYVRGGGGLVAYGALGACDAFGEGRGDAGDFLGRVFGVRPGDQVTDALISVVVDHEVGKDLRRGYPDVEKGITRLALKDCREIEVVAEDVEVVARFVEGTEGPAVLLRRVGQGRCVYFSGPPSRRARGSWVGGGGFGDSPSFARTLFANAVEWAAGGPAAARIEGLPAVTGYVRARPYDQRIVPTHEFFPMVGDEGYLLVVASYWAEAAEVKLVVDLAEGVAVRDCAVRELVRDRDAEFRVADGKLEIPVSITMQDPLLVYRVRVMSA